MIHGYKSDISQTAPDTDLSKLIEGYPTDGNRDFGTVPTVPGAIWFHMVTSELVNLVKEASLTPQKQDVTQVKQAVIALINKAIQAIDYSDFVKLSGDQTIEGIKTFATAKAKVDQATSLNDLTFITAKLARSLFGLKSTTNTWAEIQTFSKSPVVPNATANNQAVNKGQMDLAIQSGTTVPTGSIIAFAGASSALPSGYLICNGATVSRTTYANLFKVIGTTYGAGNGSTTFTLPDLRERFIEGSTTSGTYKNAGLPNITGSCYWKGVAQGFMNQSGAFKDASQTSTDPNGGGAGSDANIQLDFNAKNSNSIYSASTVQPKSITQIFIIKI